MQKDGGLSVQLTGSTYLLIYDESQVRTFLKYNIYTIRVCIAGSTA